METNRFAIWPFHEGTTWRHCIIVDLFRKRGLALWPIDLVSDKFARSPATAEANTIVQTSHAARYLEPTIPCRGAPE